MSEAIKIDKELKKIVEAFIKKGDNKIKYPSLKNFVDNAVLNFLREEESEE